MSEKPITHTALGLDDVADSISDGVNTADKSLVLDTVNAAESHCYTDADYSRVRRKIDFILLPVMWLCYGIQQADKISVSAQVTFGLLADTHMHGSQYNWLTTVFYLAYLVAELPANYLMQRTSLRYTLSACMFVWGVIVLCIGFSNNFATIVTLRALQGAAESTIAPTFLLIIAGFYARREQALRSVVWGTANAGMGIITQAAIYGISRAAYVRERNAQLSGTATYTSGLSTWRYISFFLGGLTIALSILAFFVLGAPSEVLWLSPEEKRIAAARVVDTQTGTGRQSQSEEWRWDQVHQALRDPQTYFFFFVVIVNALPNGGTTTFGNLVFVSFGFTALDTLLKGTIPQNVLAMVWFLAVGYGITKFKNTRFYFMILSTIPAFVGLIAVALLPKNRDDLLWTRWGMYFMSVTGTLPGLLIWTLLPSNVAGRTKKSVTATLMFVAYCTGNSIGAQVFQARWAPRYIPALIICAVMYGLECVLFLVWRAYYVRENRRRDRLVAASGLTAEQAAHQGRLNGESDMTDTANIHFRYSM